ncbi:MAG TPA: amidohydrolase [Vicinamibacterales bacterium]
MRSASFAREVRHMAGVAGVVCAAAGAVSCSGSSSGPSADLIVVNARVWTVDLARPEAEAVAVTGDRIVAVGTRAEVERLRGANTRVIDGAGRFLMPGFNDAHIHLMTGGAQLDSVNLKDAGTPSEFARRIGERANSAAKGEWILGGNWDEQKWTGAPLPTRDLVDGVTPDTPIFVNRYDEHMSLANSVALRLAGVTARTPDPPGGEIVRDAKGDPTGILKDAAQSYVYKVIPPPTAEQRVRTLKRALAHMASLGVTSVQDMGPDTEDVAVYRAFAARGELTTRIRAVPAEVSLARQLAAGPVRMETTRFLEVSGAKGFADGSLGSTTAYFFEPYTDTPTSRGLLAGEMRPLDDMRRRLVTIDKAGEQLCIHAIGDQAISMVLDLFADVEKANGVRDRRPRIERSQHVAPQDFDRYARLGVIASVQPYHAIDDGNWAEKRIGPERAKTTYAFRSFLDHKVRLAFGTDWPVAPLDPLQALYAAVTRATLDGKHPGGWVPEQKVSVAQAIEAYTAGAAYAEFKEKDKGTISVGRLADLVMLSGDPFSVAPEALRDLKVDMTVVGGKVVYERQ